jgi:NAD(P)-dependent dehydrogenase (short-subunit alcohol dehydrogenase family)
MAVVLITGSSSGIGFLTALTFARRGDCVYATARLPQRADELRRIAQNERLDVRVERLDATDPASVRECVERVRDAAGCIDVLINNAGVLHLGSVELLPEPLLRETFETNLFGVVTVLRAVLPTMRAQQAGTIVNVASAAGLISAPPVNWSYAASKAALGKLSDALAWEVEPFGIKVVCLHPGFYRTQLLTRSARPDDVNSPYRAYEEAIVSFFDEGISSAPDAQIVADAIVAAVERPLDATSVHVLVGEGSEHFANAYRSMSETDYKNMLRPIYGF